MKKNPSERVSQLLSDAIIGNREHPISATWMADFACQNLDPEFASPVEMRWGARNHFTKMAGHLLAKTYEPKINITIESEQLQLFEGVQYMYPAARNGEKVYVPREQMTFQEREIIKARMSRASEGLKRHVAAFNAWHREKTWQENNATERSANAGLRVSRQLSPNNA